MADNSTILEKLDGLVARFEEISTLITDPAVIADQKRYVKLTKEYKDLDDLMKARKEYIQLLGNIEEAKNILSNESDADMREMAKEELDNSQERLPVLEEEIKLMDPNLLACPDHERLIEQLIESRALVDFTQGLDIRLISRDNVSLLNKVRTKAVHFAWDNPDEDLTEYFRRFRELTSIKSDRNRRVYVLTNYGSTHEQDLYRVNTLRALGYDPYVMIYERPTAPRITRHLQRWVNNKRIFHSVSDFKDYAPMKKEV